MMEVSGNRNPVTANVETSTCECESEAVADDTNLKSKAGTTQDEDTEEKKQMPQEKQEGGKPLYGKKVGYAAIKSEYLLHDYKPTLHSEYLSEQVKKQIGDTLIKDESKNEETALGKRSSSAQDNDSGGEDEEPSSKKAKLKGRNKRRPQNERIQQKDKLCPAMKTGQDCKFGDSCKFTHDKKSFVENKLPDLSQPCPIFERFGYCRCGITCRYAKSHLDKDLENVVNTELYEKMKDSLKCCNVLTEEVKHKLWKRKYNFGRAMKSVKNAESMRNSSENKVDPQKVSSSSSNSEEKHRNTSDIVEISSTTIESHEGSNVLNDAISSDSGEKNISQTKGGGETESCKDTAITSETVTEGVRSLCEITDEEVIRLRPQEKKKVDFRNKLYLAPLTTVGNLPFRRVCKDLGVDITCGEMALASQLLKGKASEWSLIKRHPCEDTFGVQVCGAYPDLMAKCAQVLTESMDLDFIDINCGCPIDLIFKKGAGSALMGKMTKLEQISHSMIGVMGDVPLTVKIRTGVYDNKSVAHNLIPRLRDAGVSLVTLHGRSREQRYTKLADWEYISKCAKAGDPMPVFGNGDILSYEDANLHMQSSGVAGVMIARGALIKPWIFTEIKEQRHWDISSSERFDILKTYANYGLEHWGSDQQGLETTRRFLLEWLSFLHRYIPVGVLEQVPQRINERPPYYVGRNDLETLMASANCGDWIKLSEMLLGPVPPSFKFLPKHKANAYQ